MDESHRVAIQQSHAAIENTRWPSQVQLFYDGDPYDIETSPLICSAKSNDWFLYDRDLRHERVKSVNKYLNVSERVEVVERNKDGALPSLAVLPIISVCERKPKQKHKSCPINVLSITHSTY